MLVVNVPHGRCTVKVKGNSIEIDASGPWNLEFIKVLHQKLVGCASTLEADQYGVIINLFGDAIAGEEVIEAHYHFVKYANCKAVAVNFENCLTTAISRVLFERIYKKAKLTFEFFDSEKAAQAWISAQL